MKSPANRLACVLAVAVAVLVPVGAGAEDPQSEVEAIRAELERGIAKLRLPDGPAPYYASFRGVRTETLTLDASYGGLITNLFDRKARGVVDVRVGSPEFDNANFFGDESSETPVLLPLRIDSRAVRRAVWLGMDTSFRAAIAGHAAKQSAMARMAGDPLPPSLAPVPADPVNLDWADGKAKTELRDPKLQQSAVDRHALGELTKALSNRFADHPLIDNGDVIFQSMRVYRVYVSTDGVISGKMEDRAVLAVVADTQAADGMRLDHGGALHFRTIPSAKDLEGPATQLVDRVLAELEEMASAPMIEEDYDGPVLLSAHASAQLLASTVAPQAAGEPAPLSEFGTITDLEPHWQERLGKGVMPDHLDLIDDPLAEGFGHYEVDAEGVPAMKSELVKRGQLSDLLMTRTPNDVIGQSNGHARGTPSLAVASSISNLRLTSRKPGWDQRRLERDLLRRAREDGYEHAYVIEALRDPTVLGSVPRDSASIFAGGRKVHLPIPALVYRIESNGTRTLVRGAVLGPASMRVLRRIRAVGRDTEETPLRIAPSVSGGFASDLGAEGLLTSSVDVSVTTPSLLVDGLEVLVERGEWERLPTLIHPLRQGVPGDGEAEATHEPTSDGQ